MGPSWLSDYRREPCIGAGRRHRVGNLMGRTKGLAIALCASVALTAPATASAAGLIGAYERYETGKGFEIGLVNLSTGQPLPVPAAVNTTDDEVHPALSPNGRFLVFMRTRLLPKLNGDIVPPASRTLVALDRQTGVVKVQAQAQGGAGPALFESTTFGHLLYWGLEPRPCCAPNGTPFVFAAGSSAFSEAVGDSSAHSEASVPDPGAAPSGQKLETTAAVGSRTSIGRSSTGSEVFGRYQSYAYIDQNTGALQNGIVNLSGTNATFTAVTFGSPGAPAARPTPRVGDNYLAFDQATANDVAIETIGFANETQPTPAPPAINTSAPERMPAWSPDDLKLGFVRTSGDRRTLAVFDATPGLQAVVLTPVDLGPDAPTPQTRAYQSVWGGISIANAAAGDAPAVTCTGSCVRALRGSLSTAILKPKLSLSTKGQSVGIFVARVTGTRKLLGRTTPRISVVGRVPLGPTRKGANRFRWNGKVNGRRLKRGTYLLTYRALKKGRVLNTSGSIRFKVTKAGKITSARPQR
jgi:hypothetical protein